MVFLLSLIDSTVLDVTAILGISPSSFLVPSGISVDTILSRYQFDEHTVEAFMKNDQEPSKNDVHKLQKNFFNYNTLITHFAGAEGEDLKNKEHKAFLFYWYNKFIFCTKSNKCLAENMLVAEALANGHILALSPAILANLSRCLVEASVGRIDLH